MIRNNPHQVLILHSHLNWNCNQFNIHLTIHFLYPYIPNLLAPIRIILLLLLACYFPSQFLPILLPFYSHLLFIYSLPSQFWKVQLHKVERKSRACVDNLSKGNGWRNDCVGKMEGSVNLTFQYYTNLDQQLFKLSNYSIYLIGAVPSSSVFCQCQLREYSLLFISNYIQLNIQPQTLQDSNNPNMQKTGILITIGTIVRLAFILYISNFESILSQQLTTTDIDYKVYTDAAYLPSPYHRHTYRYTPLIAYMMKFNNIIQYAGKLFFVFFDIIAMIGFAVVAKKQYRTAVVALYAINPLFIYLTVRGSCESVSVALMVWVFCFLFERNGNTVFDDAINKKVKFQDYRKFALLGYVLYGLWVHVRVYPIIFLPVILLHQKKLCEKTKTSFLSKFIEISILSGGTFIGLLGIFYIKYGMLFIQQTYLYHLTRLDNRHSFSPIFYQIYLTLNTQSFMRSIAQLCIIVVVSKRLHKSISPYYAHFLITYAFVSFNKVITMQYYMWVFAALMLVLPESSLMTNSNRRFQKSFSYFMQWLLGILLWVWASIKLEKEGENVFNLMWLICVGKLFSDLWAVTGFMSTIKNKLHYQQLPNKESNDDQETSTKIVNKSKQK